jgi:fido (protein-threonine AMPylation protein)
MVLVWEPIADLPQDWSALTDGELGPLLQFWNDQRTDLEQGGALAEFNLRLAREWSIETGQIEGVYNLDRGVTETLIERGINADLIPAQPGQKLPELIAAIIQDHADVLEGLFQSVKGERPISKSYIHQLHAALLRHQDTAAMRDQFGNLFESKLQKGKYKERPNNPRKPDGTMHQYCPPEQVDPEMERLLAMHEDHIKNRVPIEIAAAWLHHRFTQIHPYQDGNGRVARALASLSLIKAGWFPVVVTRDDRPRYIDTLEASDEGDLRSLVSFFADVQRRALFQAMKAAADSQPTDTVEGAIAAAKRVLTAPGRTLDPAIWLATKETANRLMDLAADRLESLADSLRSEIGAVRPELQFQNGTSYDVIPSELPYQANKLEYQQTFGLIIKNAARRWNIEVQAHGIRSKYRGLIGIVTVFGNDSREAIFASQEPFQVNYAEPYESAERRFRPWLEESLASALTRWRKSL